MGNLRSEPGEKFVSTTGIRLKHILEELFRILAKLTELNSKRGVTDVRRTHFLYQYLKRRTKNEELFSVPFLFLNAKTQCKKFSKEFKKMVYGLHVMITCNNM